MENKYILKMLACSFLLLLTVASSKNTFAQSSKHGFVWNDDRFAFHEVNGESVWINVLLISEIVELQGEYIQFGGEKTWVKKRFCDEGELAYLENGINSGISGRIHNCYEYTYIRGGYNSQSDASEARKAFVTTWRRSNPTGKVSIFY
jgi:hypothetical protein